MTDLFANLAPPRAFKVGQANGEFLASLAAMDPAQRAHVTPDQFPDACPALVAANVKFGGCRAA